MEVYVYRKKGNRRKKREAAADEIGLSIKELEEIEMVKLTDHLKIYDDIWQDMDEYTAPSLSRYHE